MNSEQIHDALNYLDEDLILSVEHLRSGNRTGRKHWLSIAACLCLLIIGAFAAKKLGLFPIDQTPPDAGLTPTNATPTNATQVGTAATGASSATADGSDGTGATQSPTASLEEHPSILITISQWQDSGFLGEVASIIDTDAFPVGTAVSVQYTEDFAVEALDGDVLYWVYGPPDAADFPVGSTVRVQFCRSDTHWDGSVTLYAEVISKPQA